LLIDIFYNKLIINCLHRNKRKTPVMMYHYWRLLLVVSH